MKRSLIAVAIAAALAAPAFAQDMGTTSTSSSPPNAASDTNMPTPGYERWDNNPANRPATWVPGISYGYVGGGVGQSNYDNSCRGGFLCDSHDAAWNLFTGGRFSRVFGVELGYVNLGDARTDGGDARAQGVDLDLVANLPLGQYVDLFAKGGGIYGWTHSSDTLVLPGESGNDNGANWTWGAGAQFNINRNWALRADWDHYRFDYANAGDNAVSAWTANVVFKY